MADKQPDKKTRRKIQKLGKKLDAVRATEAKRLRQSAKARQEMAKRDRQAADAAARMASIESMIRDGAAGSGAKRSAGTSPAPKPPRGKPAKAVKPAAVASVKPAGATKPAGAAKAATTAKATTRQRATATEPPRPSRGTRSTTRAAKPKPTA